MTNGRCLAILVRAHVMHLMDVALSKNVQKYLPLSCLTFRILLITYTQHYIESVVHVLWDRDHCIPAVVASPAERTELS